MVTAIYVPILSPCLTVGKIEAVESWKMLAKYRCRFAENSVCVGLIYGDSWKDLEYMDVRFRYRIGRYEILWVIHILWSGVTRNS